jgi:hypothetical protein
LNLQKETTQLCQNVGKELVVSIFEDTISLSELCSRQVRRVVGSSRVEGYKFFTNLTEFLQKCKFPPSVILKMDESGLSSSKKGERMLLEMQHLLKEVETSHLSGT